MLYIKLLSGILVRMIVVILKTTIITLYYLLPIYDVNQEPEKFAFLIQAFQKTLERKMVDPIGLEPTTS